LLLCFVGISSRPWEIECSSWSTSAYALLYCAAR
jgi:hypothetical protein